MALSYCGRQRYDDVGTRTFTSITTTGTDNAIENIWYKYKMAAEREKRERYEQARYNAYVYDTSIERAKSLSEQIDDFNKALERNRQYNDYYSTAPCGTFTNTSPSGCSWNVIDDKALAKKEEPKKNSFRTLYWKRRSKQTNDD